MKTSFRLIGGALLIAASSLFASASYATVPPEMDGKPVPSLASMLQTVMPSVANIGVTGVIPVAANPFIEPGQPQRPPRHFAAFGSGVIIDSKNGYILTNAHVIRDAETITVTLNDGRVFKAKLIGADPPSDIAVLQIRADNLTPAVLANSDALKVGDFVAAIGNPFGLSQTVTSGIISALQRSDLGIEGYENFIQTDASINPGNSGGALVNLQGQVIGINTAIVSPAGGNIGIGFAIPINMARSVMVQLVKYGSVNRGLLGVLIQDLTPELANAFTLPGKAGALVAQVSPGSPAASAGILPGDVIESINGQSTKTAAELRNAIGLLREGSQVTLTILRDNKTVTVSLVTADPEKYLQASQAKNPFLYGMTLRDFNQDTPQGHLTGVQIVAVSQASMAWRAGLRSGDVILSANQTAVNNLTDLQKIAQSSKDGLLLNIYRPFGGGAAFVLLKKPQGD